MSNDDKPILDALGNLPVHLRQYTDGVAEYIEDHVDQAADFVRRTLSSQPWIPEVIKPPPLPQPELPVAALSRFERFQGWLGRHKILTGIIIVACGTAAYRGYQHNQSLRKVRRARRTRNGGRTEVVVIAGLASLPLTKSLALDMERRGYIVYVVCNAAEDETAVSALARPDIRPLVLDTTDPPKAGSAIERFAAQLQSPPAPGPNMKPSPLTLQAVILIPSLHYQTSPIATIPPSSFADLFNTHLLQPILTIQAFLPLLTSRLQPAGEKWVPPKVLVFTPSIISSINPPFHAPEATVCSALSAFTEVLAAELRPLDIPVTHMQLGTFDFSGFMPAKQAAAMIAGNPEDTLVWPDGARHVYGRNFIAQTSSAISGGRIRGLRGSSLRHLHTSVFDVIDGSITSSTVRVGLGAGVYGFVGRWVPRGLVAWMMGIRRVDQLSTWKTTSDEGSSVDESDDGDGDGDGDSAGEFVAVPQEEKNVWHAETEGNVWSPPRRPL